MRLLLLIFLLCVSNFVGIAKIRIDSSSDGSPCRHQSKLSTACSTDDHSALPALDMVKYSSSELNVNFDIENNQSSIHLNIVHLTKNGIGFNDINLYKSFSNAPVCLTNRGL